jgi:hypothetical protein
LICINLGTNCETKKQIGKVDKLREKQLEKAKQIKMAGGQVNEDDEEFNYNDDDDSLSDIQTIAVGF